jgi:GNAT superfamily N-acetyltransferase
MASWKIELLASSHEREAFACGKAPLDNFLKNLAGQYERRRLARTFVAVAPGQREVLGYYTAATGSFAVDSLPRKERKGLPKHPLPTVHLGRLAVDRRCQGQGLGKTLLFHCLLHALGVSRSLGVFAVDVWSIDEEAAQFYLKYGFIPLQDAPSHLYLPIRTIEQLFPEDATPGQPPQPA